MRTFIKLALICILSTAVLSNEDEFILNSREHPVATISYVSFSEVPMIEIDGKESPFEQIAIKPASLKLHYNYLPIEAYITVIFLKESDEKLISLQVLQNDLNDLVYFLGRHYKVTTGGPTLTFSEKSSKDSFTHADWKNGLKVSYYLDDEQGLYGTLLVLLNCEEFVKDNHMVSDLHLKKSDVSLELLSKVYEDKCENVQGVAKAMNQKVTHKLTTLLTDVYGLDKTEALAQRRISSLVDKVQEDIKVYNKKHGSSLLFLE
jgi:hypothetical protein